MHSHTVQPISMKLSRNGLYTQGKVDIYFFLKIMESYGCCRQPFKLANRIAVFENVQEIGREGGPKAV